MRLLTTVLFVSAIYSLSAQEVVDGSFEFQTDPAKKYSLYIPSGYDDSTPHALMLGLHPFNVNRWDGESWRDTLIAFAETNNLLLVCPDGGVDGKIDSPIDTAFTTTLLDSVSQWYNINEEEKYIMGFSWGGKTTYTYGLRRTNKFNGYLIIGAAITLGEVNGIAENATNEKFYVVHGENDSPSVGFTPLVEVLEQNDACVATFFMPNTGHTIDFPGRNMILSDGFQYLKDFNCQISSTEVLNDTNTKVFPNPSFGQFTFNDLDLRNHQIQVFDLQGQSIPFRYDNQGQITISGFKGVCLLHLATSKTQEVIKLLIL